MIELSVEIDSVINEKSVDSREIKAERIKRVDDKTQPMFNLIIKQNSSAPSGWKVFDTAIFEKGSATSPESCRLICGLFTTSQILLHNVTLPNWRRGCSAPACRSGRIRKDVPKFGPLDMWAAPVDSKRAFDSMQHKVIWNSFRKQSNSERYIADWKTIFWQACHHSDWCWTWRIQNCPWCKTRRFLEQSFLQVGLANCGGEKHGNLKAWARRSHIQLVVLMMASSLKQPKNAEDFQKVEAHGGEFHPNKSKVLTSQKANTQRNRPRMARDAGRDISSGSSWSRHQPMSTPVALWIVTVSVLHGVWEGVSALKFIDT